MNDRLRKPVSSFWTSLLACLALSSWILVACVTTGTTPATPSAAVTETVAAATATSQPPTPASPASATLAPSATEITPTAVPTATATVTDTATVTGTTTAPAFTSLSMLDENTGWAVSEQAVLRTTDGGSNWTSVSPQGLSTIGTAASAFFRDASTAWVLIPKPPDNKTGTLYHTTDAGQSWDSAGVPFGFADLQFLNDQTGSALAGRGFAAGSEAVDVYQTSDGGQTWDQVYSIDPTKPQGPGSLPFGGDKTGMTFLDPQHGWVTGTEPKDGYVWLFATKNGGHTWQHQDIPLPTGYMSSTVVVDPPRFFSDQDGVLPVRLFANVPQMDFYLTHDSGATWESTNLAAVDGPYDVSSLQDFWVWSGARLEASHDGGQTWETIQPNVNFSQIIGRLDFVSSTTGWATTMDANGNNQLYRTNDGGVTWTPLFP